MKLLKISILCGFIIIFTSSHMVIGDISSMLPPSDLGSIYYFDEDFELQFTYTLTDSAQSFIIIKIDYPETLLSYSSFTVSRYTNDVSSWFTESDDGDAVMISCDAVSNPIGKYVVSIQFNPIQVGACSFSWRSIVGTFGEPPSVPDVEDVTVTSQGTVSASIQIDLLTGWNLIGVPVECTDSSITGIFGAEIGKVNYIYAYQSGEYSYWIQGLDPSAQTLSNLQSGSGYWINMAQDTSVTLEGDIGNPFSATDEWNLIALNSKGPISTEDALTSYSWASIYGYDESAQIWVYLINNDPVMGDLTQLSHGEGYWLNLNLQ